LEDEQYPRKRVHRKFVGRLNTKPTSNNNNCVLLSVMNQHRKYFYFTIFYSEENYEKKCSIEFPNIKVSGTTGEDRSNAADYIKTLSYNFTPQIIS